jgi:hypothetical protein
VGYPSLVLGAIASFLEPFRGHSSPNIDNVSEKLTLRYPHEEPCVDRGHPPGVPRPAQGSFAHLALSPDKTSPHPALPAVHGELDGRTVKRFCGGLVFKAHRLFNYSALGSRVTKKKRGGLRGGVTSRGRRKAAGRRARLDASRQNMRRAEGRDVARDVTMGTLI